MGKKTVKQGTKINSGKKKSQSFRPRSGPRTQIPSQIPDAQSDEYQKPSVHVDDLDMAWNEREDHRTHS